MKRDMDVVRRLPLVVERETAPGIIGPETDENPFTSPSPIYKHWPLLIEAGLISGEVRDAGGSEGMQNYYLDCELTWKGHEFLDSVRDPEVWRLTKEGTAKVGGASVEFMWGIAKTIGKQAVTDRGSTSDEQLSLSPR